MKHTWIVLNYKYKFCNLFIKTTCKLEAENLLLSAISIYNVCDNHW
jgi:hypothetical protein